MDGLYLRPAARSPRSARAAFLTTVFFWLFHVPGFYVDTRSWVANAAILGFLLLSHLANRFIVGWLYNGAGAGVLIDGLFTRCTTRW